ncbi:zf-HC2 domain-containing protein [Saccharothrix sp. HUAS TT1]|uniref:zf-HC2 domain-containing protein n=1 Tax=unclassified Saccharothrix TaxID=2593673 RepID=UPI00345C1202
MSCDRTVALGAYLLGSLDPAERSAFERHVRGCATCRREMVRLAPLPGLLGQVQLTDLELPFDDPAPDPDLRPLPPLPTVPTADGPARRNGVEPGGAVPTEAGPPHGAREHDWQEGVRKRRWPVSVGARGRWKPVSEGARRRRWSVLVGAAAVVLLVALAAVVVPGWTGDDAPAAVTWHAADTASGVVASADLVGRSWGTELRMTVENVPAGLRCKLIVHDRTGRTEVGGWWGADHAADERIPGSTSFPVDRIERLDLVVDMTVLVSVRP